MAAPVEVLPGDRPIFMIGQPIIRLFASGGPGSDLGDIQAEIKRYYTPKAIPGLSPDKEGPQTNRYGIYPRKLSEHVSYDDTLGCCGNMVNLGDLACCGAEEGMGDTPESAAKAASDQCKSLDALVAKVADQIKQAESSKGMTKGQKAATIAAFKRQIQGLRAAFKDCLRYLKGLVKSHRKRIEAAGLSDVAKYADKHAALEACRDRLVACNRRYADHMKTHHGK